MEFEKVWYRVHDVALRTLEQNRPRGGARPLGALRLLTELCFMTALLVVFLSASLHADLESSDCLLPSLRLALAVPGLDSANETAWHLPRDVLVQIRISSSDRHLSQRRLGNQTAAGFVPSEVKVDYTLARDSDLLLLDANFLAVHALRLVNVTIAAPCLAHDSALHQWAHRVVLGYDTPVINQAMFALGGAGALRGPSKTWSWSARRVKQRVQALEGLSFGGGGKWVTNKYLVVCKALLAFAVITSVTALTLRVVLASGAVALFAAWYAADALRPLDFRPLAAAFPWLGAPLELLRAQREAAAPLLWGHAVRVVVALIVYDACRTRFVQWFYDSVAMDAGVSLSVEMLVLLWELSSLVFLRAAPSVTLVPKLSWLYFTTFHIVLYSRARPYAGLNLTACALAMLHALLYAVVAFELPAFSRGDISAARPRAACTTLPWPALDAMLPPDWSLFVPLSLLDASTPLDQFHAAAAETRQPTDAADAAAGGNGADDGASALLPAETETETSNPIRGPDAPPNARVAGRAVAPGDSTSDDANGLGAADDALGSSDALLGSATAATASSPRRVAAAPVDVEAPR